MWPCIPSTPASRPTWTPRRSTSSASTRTSARPSRATWQRCCAARSSPRDSGEPCAWLPKLRSSST
ncbi:MAG: hypothetical protein E6K43_07835 [Gammaproteobacteria bacterium]|nr:MAG: hypothetical protein E6K43_07835 [Gammaproteobacteria bacterium]